jgi:hypothetical protein
MVKVAGETGVDWPGVSWVRRFDDPGRSVGVDEHGIDSASVRVLQHLGRGVPVSPEMRESPGCR